MNPVNPLLIFSIYHFKERTDTKGSYVSIRDPTENSESKKHNGYIVFCN